MFATIVFIFVVYRILLLFLDDHDGMLDNKYLIFSKYTDTKDKPKLNRPKKTTFFWKLTQRQSKQAKVIFIF